MRYVKVNGPFAYQHVIEGRWVETRTGVRFRLPDTDQLEVVEPGSIVPLEDNMAESFVARGRGVFCEGPEKLIRPHSDDTSPVERPGLDVRPARAERAVTAAQRA